MSVLFQNYQVIQFLYLIQWFIALWGWDLDGNLKQVEAKA